MVRVVSLDLDGTLLEGTVFQAILKHVGQGPWCDWTDRLYEAGVLSLEATFFAQYNRLVGVPIRTVEAALDRAPWRPQLEAVVAALKRAGSRVIVCTDQPSWAVAYLRRFGLDEASCTHARVVNDRVGPVETYAFDKAAALGRWLAREGVAWADVVHVGNGVNDIPVFRRAGASVAVYAHAGVAEHARAEIKDLAELPALVRNR